MRPRHLLPRVQGESGARAQGRRACWGPPVPMLILVPWNQVKPAGELCRPVKDQCDLGEHCDGQQPTCPEDAFRENGTPCPGGYCYNGACPTLARRCQDLWGPGEAGTAAGPSGRQGWQQVPSRRTDPLLPAGSRVAVETCFLYSISKGCGAGVPLPFGR